MPKRILVVEDDRDISELIRYNLQREGYEVSVVFDGSLAFEHAVKIKPDLILLDLMLPEVDGLEICRLLKSDKEVKGVPVVMLTAKSEESDIILGLQMGADDYIAKPFSPKVLIARVKAIMRRLSKVDGDAVGVDRREYGHLVLDLLKHKVMYRDEMVVLTSIEFDILEFRISNDHLSEAFWGDFRFYQICLTDTIQTEQ